MYGFDRRQFMALAASACAFAPVPAFALSQSGAKQLVDTLVADINRVIASGKSEKAMYVDFENIFKRYADTRLIAAYAMGVDGRRASSAQKSAFTAAFTGYISRKYGKRFREFIGGKLEVTGTSAIKNGVSVSAVAHLRGEAPFEVAFHVSDQSGRPLFFNMYIEGINMLLTERSEIGAMIDRRGGNIDKMIADLRTAS